MDDPTPLDNVQLAARIARLVQERGWNQEEFARIARLNRHTIRQILAEGGTRRLRNSTLNACARALGLTVSELREQPLDRLLPRMQDAHPANTEDPLRRLYNGAKLAELVDWLERNPDRARKLTTGDVEEILAWQGRDEPGQGAALPAFLEQLERRHALFEKVRAVAESDHLALLEQLVDLLHDKLTPRT